MSNYQRKVTLRRVKLDSQGYANNGRHYYGVGQHLYWYCCEGEGYEHDIYFRAANRIAAKRFVQSLPSMSKCKFYS